DTGEHVMLAIDMAASRGEPLPVRFAALLHDLGKGTTPADILPRHIGHEHRSVELGELVCARLKVPTECKDLALLTARYHGDIHRAGDLKPGTVVTLLERVDALRRPERFEQLLAACACDFNGRKDWEEKPYPSPARLRTALTAARGIDAGAVARAAAERGKIPEAIHQARVAAVKAALREND
ncbi:MAG TPA: HD domain-containing protein, partial [Azospira sp.]|nr:HD domain-containing protein [Azospira sp.]